MTRRHSKIAQLPKELRGQVNLMIQSHACSRKIIEFLSQSGHLEINEVNITNWIKGDRSGSSGYHDWLRERQHLLAMQARCEFASDVLRQGDGPQIHEATRLMAAAQLSEVILGFDIQKLKKALSAKPLAFATLVTSLRRLSRDNLAYQKYRQLGEGRNVKIHASLRAVKEGEGFTPEAIKQMQEALHRL